MKYLRNILYRFVFVAFTSIGRIKPLYEVVGCLYLVYRCKDFRMEQQSQLGPRYRSRFHRRASTI